MLGGNALQQSLNFEIGKPVVGGINIDRYGIKKDFKELHNKPGVTYNNKAVIKDNSLLFQKYYSSYSKSISLILN